VTGPLAPDETLPLVSVSICPYCKSEHLVSWFSHVYDRLRISKRPWEFLRCLDCNSAILSPHPPRNALADYYPAHYLFTSRESGPTTNPLSWLQYCFFYRFFRLPFIRYLSAHFLDGGSAPSLLDIGCGTGELLSHYINKGIEVHALDFSEASIAKVKTLPKVQAYSSALEELGTLFPTKRFDFIIAFHLLEHVAEPFALIAQCHELLKPRGRLIIIVPVIDCIQASIFGRFFTGLTEAPRHMTLPSLRGLKSALKAAHFGELQMISPSLLECAGLISLSLLPQSAEHFQHTKAITPKILRLMAALLTLICVPLVWIEINLYKRPAIITLSAQKN